VAEAGLDVGEAAADLAAQAGVVDAGRAGLQALSSRFGRDRLEAGGEELGQRLGGAEGHAEDAGTGCRIERRVERGEGSAKRRALHSPRSTQTILLQLACEDAGLRFGHLLQQYDGRFSPGDGLHALAQLGMLDRQVPEEVGFVLAVAEAAGHGQGQFEEGAGAAGVSQPGIGDAQTLQGGFLLVAVRPFPGLRQVALEQLPGPQRLVQLESGQAQVSEDVRLRRPVPQPADERQRFLQPRRRPLASPSESDMIPRSESAAASPRLSPRWRAAARSCSP
jgi:hypothetical protein